METIVSSRFVEENLAQHWRVDSSKESFNCLMNHLENKTNCKVYFEQSLERLPWDEMGDNLVGVDFGAGVGWTSSILAKKSCVNKIYAVEPSVERANRTKSIAAHFQVQGEKIESVNGNFTNFELPEKIDFVVMCASFHHGLDDELNRFFKKIVSYKRRKTLYVLIANEHYVTPLFTMHRSLAYYLKHYAKRKELYYGPKQWRHYDTWDHEHFRSKKEVENIFTKANFDYEIYIHNGDLCKDKPPILTKLEWRYYHALLKYVGPN